MHRQVVPAATSVRRMHAATLLSPDRSPDIHPWFSSTVKHKIAINMLNLIIINSSDQVSSFVKIKVLPQTK